MADSTICHWPDLRIPLRWLAPRTCSKSTMLYLRWNFVLRKCK